MAQHGGMDVTAALSLLYGLSGLAACVCYWPQLWRLARDPVARRSLALVSWGGWLAVSVVGIAYAVVVTGQPEMVVVAAANALCQAAVVALGVHQRRRDACAMKNAGQGGGLPGVGSWSGGA